MVSYVPLPLLKDELDRLVSDAKDFVCGHGEFIIQLKSLKLNFDLESYAVCVGFSH
jgi:hypothetical protein